MNAEGAKLPPAALKWHIGLRASSAMGIRLG